MITTAEEQEILQRAYVPEHIVSLMGIISQGEPFLLADLLIFCKDNWVILVGYPLEGEFNQEALAEAIEKTLIRFRPEYLWIIAPELPDSLAQTCQERERDWYYSLDMGEGNITNRLKSIAHKAAERLSITRSREFTQENEVLVGEFLQRTELPPRVVELYLAMPRYLSRSKTALVLNAWDGEGKLAAFYVLDLAARWFTTYLLGCFSRLNYIPHASDLLFYKMIELSLEMGKKSINLGLGLNDGIRRFKTKWGGKPIYPYDYGEIHYPVNKTFSLLGALQRIF